MKVYYTGTDGGDGSVGVSFYDSKACIEKLEKHDPEGHRGEGGGWFEVPDGTKITGIEIETMADVDEYLFDMGLTEADDSATEDEEEVEND